MASFDPQDTEADEETIRAAADDLYDVAGRIIGRSGDLRSAFTGAAVEFTDLVTEDIRGEGDYDEQLWQRSSMAVVYAAGVTDMWADDVKWFKDKRQQLIGDWEDEVADDFGVPREPTPEPGPPPVAPGETPPERPSPTAGRDAKIAEKRQERLDHYNGEAADLWEKFQDRAEEKGQMLRDGPEPEHVRELVDAGVLGWAPYNIMGAASEPPLPLTEDEAVRMANNLDRYLSEDGAELDAEYAEILAALAVISLKAQEAQKNGGRLPAGEIAFLERFYAELDDADGDHDLPYNVVEIPRHLDELDTMSDEEKEELLKVLGEGILTLSDEDLGGGFHDLPESVQNAARGPLLEEDDPDADDGEWEFPYGYVQWGEDLVDLGRLLGGTDSDLHGGERLSTTLTSSLAHEMVDPALGYPLNLTSETAIPLIEVSTRNSEANHAILTGDYEHPRHGTDPDKVLEGLYTFEWSDDGAAASGLTNWITEASQSDDESERALAGEAAVALIGRTTSNDMFTTLTDTEIKVGEDKNASFTQVNPNLARSLAGVALSYLDDFARDADDGQYEFDADSGELHLDTMSRMRFLQYAVADEDAAASLVRGVEGREWDQLNRYVSGDLQGDPFQTGNDNGRLRGLLDAAFGNEAKDRVGDKFAEDTKEAEARKAGLGMLSADLRIIGVAVGGASKLNPVTAAASEIVLSITDEAVRYGLGQQDGPSVEYVPTNSGDSETTRTSLGTQTRLQMLDALLQDGRIKASDVPPELLAEDTEGGDRIRPLHEFPRSDGRELDRIAEGLIVEHGAEEVTDDYRDEYWNGYADVRDAYRAVDLDDYEKLEQGIRLTN